MTHHGGAPASVAVAALQWQKATSFGQGVAVAAPRALSPTLLSGQEGMMLVLVMML